MGRFRDPMFGAGLGGPKKACVFLMLLEQKEDVLFIHVPQSCALQIPNLTTLTGHRVSEEYSGHPPRAGQTQAPSQPELLCSTRSAVALKFTIAMAARRMLAGDPESYHDLS